MIKFIKNLVSKVFRLIIKPSSIFYNEINLSFYVMTVCFATTVNYYIFKVLKDTLILSIPGGQGKLLMAVLKIWAIMPSSILFTAIIVHVNRHISLRKIFYILSCIYLVSIISFVIVYPNIEILYLHKFYTASDSLLKNSIFSKVLLPILKLIEFWPLTLFYIFAEMWHTNIYLFVFWGILNSEFSTLRAKRLYPILNLVGNSAGFIIAPIFTVVSSFKNDWNVQLQLVLMISCLFILISVISFYFSMKFIDNEITENHALNYGVSAQKIKISLMSGIKKILESQYLMSLMSTILCYNIVLNITELVWKGMLSDVYQNDKIMIANQLSLLSSSIAIMSTIIGFLLPFMLNYLGMRITGILYPISVMIPIGLFSIKAILHYTNINAIETPCEFMRFIWLGHIGLVVIRAGKYTLYDTIKDLCLNVLDSKTMLESKSAIDGVISRLGKSFGSISYNVFTAVFSENIASVLSEFFVLCIGIFWILAMGTLGALYDTRQTQQTMKKQ